MSSDPDPAAPTVEPTSGIGWPLAWPLVSAEEMRALDRHAIEALGVDAEILMESAGRAVVEVVLERLAPGEPVLVVCGRGNNGGDGLVAARHLRQLGADVRIDLLGADADRSAPSLRNLERARSAGVPSADVAQLSPARGVIVDAIFGTGLSRPVEGAAAERIGQIAACRSGGSGGVRVVAVDLPSGLCADTGAALGQCVEADVTVALGLPKLGLALEPGRSAAGEIRVARIGIGDGPPSWKPAATLWTRAGAAAHLPPRPVAGHKGTFGHALIVAGSEGKTGAAALAALGAGRVGAGLITLACPAGLNDILEVKCTEAMTVPVADTPERSFAASAVEAVIALAATRGAVGLGPGVGRSDETQALLRSLAKRLDVPLVIDADGLFPFRSEPDLLRDRSAPTVVTPHPGEAAGLLGQGADALNRDRPQAARRLAERLGAVVLLKGAASVIAAPDGRVAVNPTGGPALATGGTGDVLLGMLTGLLVQGLGAWESAVLAAFVHGAAADRLAARSGASGLLATELAAEVPATLAELRDTECDRVAAPVGLAVRFPEP